MTKQKQAGHSRGALGTVKTIVIDDQLVFRLGLRMYLASAMREIEWAGEAESVEAGLSLADRVRPDLILIDASLGDENIAAVLPRLRAKRPDSAIIVLANLPDSKNLALAAGAGADGYMLKTLPPDQMVAALREVLQGTIWIQPELARQLYADFARDSRMAGSGQGEDIELTPRQLEVLQLIAQGLRNADIADRLTISEQTVKTHVAHLLEKLRVSSRLQAARYAISKKLVDA